MKGWTKGILAEMERLPTIILQPFVDGQPPKGVWNIQLKLDAPDFEPFLSEMNRLTQVLHGEDFE
jgi:hypothetical protein